MFQEPLRALKRAGRFRERQLLSDVQYDLASNDYLGLAEKRSLAKKAFDRLMTSDTYGPKASQLVNGYHPIHIAFEEALCLANDFDAGLVVGSGFLANIALIEALPRKGDLLLMDEEYHASGVLASDLTDAKVITFPHNDVEAARHALATERYKSAFIAIEGVYSMEGDLCDAGFFDLADGFDAYLIVDEAHSSGVVGPNLMGVFDHYNITPKRNHIKMGTLGKAYGSYGAYILANPEVISFLENRAKSVIYATAPSLFDIALAHESLLYIQKKASKLKEQINTIHTLVKAKTGYDVPALILPLPVQDSEHALELQKALRAHEIVVGAIRPPTVNTPILRIILRITEQKALKKLFKLLRELKVLSPD